MKSLKNSQFFPTTGRLERAATTDIKGEKKVRLLKFVCDFGSGGTEGQVYNLSKGLSSSHFDLEIAALNKTGPFVDKYEQDGITINEFPIQSFFSLEAFLQLIRLTKYLRKNRIDIVHAYNFYSIIFSIPAAKLAGVPVVIASIRDQGVYLTKSQKWMQRAVCLLADRILVNSESIKQWLLDQGYQQSKITLIKNGIDLSSSESLGITTSKKSNIRKELEIKDNAPLVVMIARLNKHKGVADFIEAAALVNREHPQARFLLIGKPSKDSVSADKGSISDQQQWFALRRQLKLEKVVFFCGYRSDVAQILSQAAVSVLPSHSEGISNTLLESMAAGVPIVSTRVGGASELVEEGVDGILVPAHCPQQLAGGISRILNSIELAQRLSLAARQKVTDNFSLHSMVENTKKVYASHSVKRGFLTRWLLKD